MASSRPEAAERAVGLTVAIPTFRRLELVRGAVDSVVTQSTEFPVEVLVIDGDPDGSAVRALAAAALPANVRVIRTKGAGSSKARNIALEEARYDVLAFLDDDAAAEAGWLVEIASAYQDSSVAAAGGPITPFFTAQPPRWLRDAYDLAEAEFGALDYGAGPCRLEFPRYLNGPNLSVRRSVGMACGGFREDLGVHGTRWSPGEDTDLIRRLQALGHTVMWVPSAAVRHLVTPEKMTRRFLRRRVFAKGMATARGGVGDPEDRARSQTSALPRIAAAIVYHYVLSQVLWVAGNRRGAVLHDLAWARWLGIMIGRIGQFVQQTAY